MSASASVLLLSGGGRFTDPWHPFAAGSARLASLIEHLGHRVQVRPTTPSMFDFEGIDLVVVNAGGGNPERTLQERRVSTEAWDAAFERFGDWIDAGGPVLAVHTSANTFGNWPRWRQLLGGAWIPGRSGHPARSLATFEVVTAEHPVLRGIDQVRSDDERYSDLELDEGITPLLAHHTDGRTQVMAWVGPGSRGSRIIYDGLGHDASAYEAPDRQRLLAGEIGWLLGGDQ